MRLISFVLAVYHNELAITETYNAVAELFKTKLTRYQFEIVYVDDGSKDGSLKEIQGLAADDSRVRYVSFTRNFGQNAAIQCGLQHAHGDAVVSVSCDLQDPIELVADMATEWENGAELVAGFRERRTDRISSQLSSRLFYRIIRFSFPEIPAGGFDYVLMDRKVVDAFNSVQVRNRFIQGDFLWFGYRVKFIPYMRKNRRFGRSQYNFAKRLKNAADAILDASYLPVRMISLAGITTALVGFVYALAVIAARITHDVPFPGWAPIVVLQLVIGGVIMLMLGVLGEYVWRIYDEVRGKPNFVIRTASSWDAASRPDVSDRAS